MSEMPPTDSGLPDDYDAWSVVSSDPDYDDVSETSGDEIEFADSLEFMPTSSDEGPSNPVEVGASTRSASPTSISVQVYPFLGVRTRAQQGGVDLTIRPMRSILDWHIRILDTEWTELPELRKLFKAVVREVTKHPGQHGHQALTRHSLAWCAKMAGSQNDEQDWRLALSIYRSYLTDSIIKTVQERLNASRKDRKLTPLRLEMAADYDAARGIQLNNASSMATRIRLNNAYSMALGFTKYEHVVTECDELEGDDWRTRSAARSWYDRPSDQPSSCTNQ